MPDEAGRVNPAGPAHVVVGVDCTDDSRHLLRAAADVATRLDADLDVVYAYPRPLHQHGPDDDTAAVAVHHHQRNVLGSTVTEALGPHRPRTALTAVPGDPARALLTHARHTSLLVVGDRARTVTASLLLGSVATRCLARHHGPVLVVPHRGTGETTDALADGIAVLVVPASHHHRVPGGPLFSGAARAISGADRPVLVLPAADAAPEVLRAVGPYVVSHGI
jgi:nucleotide-binding universal stress UspA family protein